MKASKPCQFLILKGGLTCKNHIFKNQIWFLVLLGSSGNVQRHLAVTARMSLFRVKAWFTCDVLASSPGPGTAAVYCEELLARLRGNKAVMADEENSPSSDPAAL